MIALILYDLRWRVLWLVPLGLLLYSLEPGFHQHEAFDVDAVSLGPIGISAAMAHYAALGMMILLAGFISRDRHEGYTRLYFSNPTPPLTYYALRFAISYGIAMTAGLLFLTLGQIVAWGRFPAGWQGLLLPALTALIYGSVVAFFSVILPRGDGFVGFLLFLPTLLPEILSLGLANSSVAVRQAVLLLVPPQGAIIRIWEGLQYGIIPWSAIVYCIAYASIFLIAGSLILKSREWP